MKTTVAIRKKLGLSQHQLAHYLAITRSQLVMYETGKRDLPTSALIQLAAIELFLNQSEITNMPPITLTEVQIEGIQKEMSKLQKENEFKQIQLKMQLEAIENKALQKQNLQALVNHLSATSTDERALKVLQDVSSSGSTTMTELKQVELQMKLHLLYAQNNFIKELTKAIQNSQTIPKV